MAGNLLQSLGLQPILDQREREAMAYGQAYQKKYAQEFEATQRKKQRKSGLLTTILTTGGLIAGAAIGGGAGASLGATAGKGLGGMLQPSSSTQQTAIQTPQMPMYQSYPYNQPQSRGGLYA